MSFDHTCKNKRQKLDAWNEQKKDISVREIERETHNETISGFPLQKHIYWIEFGENIGYELSEKHPGLIISANHYNKTGTVIVAPISSGKIRRDRHILQCQYILFKYNYPRLEKDSLIKLDQMRVISVSRVLNEMCYIDSDDWKRISSRIKKTFAI